jgi:hypothetical protein
MLCNLIFLREQIITLCVLVGQFVWDVRVHRLADRIVLEMLVFLAIGNVMEMKRASLDFLVRETEVFVLFQVLIIQLFVVMVHHVIVLALLVRLAFVIMETLLLEFAEQELIVSSVI